VPIAAQIPTLPHLPNPLRSNLERVRERIALGCAAVGRSASTVRLVAVTKSVAPEVARELLRCGQLDLAENRVDRLERMSAALADQAPPPRWHMVGHLQRNKARRALAVAGAVHSVDSIALLETLERLCAEIDRTVDVYLEVRAIDAGQRSGFAPADLPGGVERVAELRHLRLRGLMAMAAPAAGARPGDLASQSDARRTFASVRALAQSLPRACFVASAVELSMGMSSDLEAALAEGAHVVRIGTALFEGVPGGESTP
jgi:hypothetical protein